MTQINWGLAGGPSAFDNALAQGFKIGQHVKQQRQKTETQNALAAYAASPDDPASIQGVVKADPKVGIPLMQEQRKRAAELAQQDVSRRAAAGEPAAMAQLAGMDLNAWRGLQSDQRAQAAQEAKVLGNAALDVLNASPEQRSQRIMAYAQQMGGNEAIARLAQLPPDQQEQALRSAVAQADMIGKLHDMEQPKVMPVQPGGYIAEIGRDGTARYIVAPQGQAPGLAQAPPKQTKQLGGKTYIQDANGDWYEDDGGATPGGSPTFREAFAGY